MLDELKRIAAGGSMDVVVAVRLLAAQMVIQDEQIAKLAAPAASPAPVVASIDVESDVAEGDSFDGFPERLKTALWKAGYNTLEDIAAATDEQLAAINGVGPSTLKALRKIAPYGGAA